ncbi:MAG: DUF3313 family protein [Halioglobus sp.]
MKYSVVAGLLAALSLVACESTPQLQTGKDAEVIEGNLVRVDNTSAKMVYVDPEADFSKYKAIQLAPLGVDNVEIVQPTANTLLTGNRKWELTDTDKQKLQRDFQQAMTKQLSDKGGFTLVDTPGDNVLRVSAMLTRIAPPLRRTTIAPDPSGVTRYFRKARANWISPLYSVIPRPGRYWRWPRTPGPGLRSGESTTA